MNTVLRLVTVFLVITAPKAVACSVCFGDPESGQTQGMNMAILTLMGVVMFVLACIAATAFVMMRRAQAVNGTAQSDVVTWADTVSPGELRHG